MEHLQPLRSPYDDFRDTYNEWVKTQNIADFKAGSKVLKEKYHIDKDTRLGNMYKQWQNNVILEIFMASSKKSGRKMLVVDIKKLVKWTI